MNDIQATLAFAPTSHGADNSVASIICLAIAILGLIGLAQTFAKAGKPRWGVLVPIYNVILLLQIAQRPIWWFLLLLMPGVNVLVTIVLSLDIARVFGKGPLFGCGLAFLGFVFYPILGFGDAEYWHPPARDPSSPSSFLPRNAADIKQRFNELGFSVVKNYQGRGITVGFGRGSDVSGDHLSYLIPLSLNELYLSRTRIGDESIASLEAMSQLRVLDLSNTKVSRDGIKRLRDSLPHAEIMG